MNTIERIYPDMEKVFGKFEIAGAKKVHRTWNSQLRRQQPSSVEIATYIEEDRYVSGDVRILLPGTASSLDYEVGTAVIPIEPYLTAKGMRFASGNGGYAAFFLHADMLFAEDERNKIRDYKASGKHVEQSDSAGFAINGDFPINAVKQFGTLLFDKIHREAQQLDEYGTPIGIKHRTYNLRSTALGHMVQVIVPVEIPEIMFSKGTPVELINPVCNVIINIVDNSPVVNVHFRVDNFVQLGKNPQTNGGGTSAPKHEGKPESQEKKPA